MEHLLQGLTAGIAVAALVISFWQGHRSSELARQANAGPVMASVYGQFRDPEFRHAIVALRAIKGGDPAAGFDGLPVAVRDHAYVVCYFFQYLGLQVAFGHLDRDLVLESMSTQLVEVWTLMRPWIAGERAVRAAVPDSYQGKRFLPHYEHLVALIVLARDGRGGGVTRDGRLYSFQRGHALWSGGDPAASLDPGSWPTF